MFHVDVTVEDLRIIASDTDCPGLDTDSLVVVFCDGHSGKRWATSMTLFALGRVLAYLCSGNDGQSVPEITYDEIDKALKTDPENPCPPECRPIP